MPLPVILFGLTTAKILVLRPLLERKTIIIEVCGSKKKVNKSEAVDVWEDEKGFEKVNVYESTFIMTSKENIVRHPCPPNPVKSNTYSHCGMIGRNLVLDIWSRKWKNMGRLKRE